MNLFKKFYKNTKGGSAIEFAVVVPSCLLIVFGIIEFGYVMWAWANLNYATSYAARYAYINKTASPTAINNFALSKLSLTGSPVTFTTNQTSTSVTISGVFNYSFLAVPLSPISISDQVQASVPTTF